MTVSLSSVHRPESNEAVRDELRLEIKKDNKGIVPQRGNRRRQQCRGSRADTSSVAVADYRIQMIQRQRPRTPSWNAASTPLFLGLHWLQTKHGGSDGRKKWGGEAESKKGNTWLFTLVVAEPSTLAQDTSGLDGSYGYTVEFLLPCFLEAGREFLLPSKVFFLFHAKAVLASR